MVAISCLLVALFAYGGNDRGWMPDGVAVPVALVGVLGFAVATVMCTFVRRSSRR